MRSRIFPALALVLALVSCGRSGGGGGKKETGKPERTTNPRVSRATDEVPSSGRKDLHTDRYRFGDATDADGIVVRETDAIPPGSTAAMSLFLRNAPAGTEVRIVWRDLAKDAIAGDDVKAIGEKGFVAFQQGNPFPQGDYRVEMFYRLPGQKAWQNLGTKDFRVGTKR